MISQHKRKIVAVILLSGILALGFAIYSFVEKEEPSCEGRKWNSPDEYWDCKFPQPPIGRWHAVYTKEFAEEYNLPPENISTNLSPGVDYMEMDVQPWGTGFRGTACLANMLVKKPHDIAFFPWSHKGLPQLSEDRKLLHWMNLEKHKGHLKSIGSFASSSRDYLPDTSGYMQSTFAMYAEDVLPKYDYISTNMQCRKASMNTQYFPSGYAFWVHKASVWGRYEQNFSHMYAPGRPHGKEFFEAHFFINIPHELITHIFKDVPVGG